MYRLVFVFLFLCALLARAASARAELQVNREEGRLSARTPGDTAPRWTLLLVPPPGPSERAPLLGPARVGPLVYAAAGSSLYLIDAETGQVRRRFYLPDSAVALQPAGAGVEVEVGSKEAPAWSRRFTIGPEGPPPPFFLPGHLVGAMLPRRQAKAATLAQLPELARQDPTNPWYDFQRGELLHKEGRAADALAAYREALQHDAAYDLELMGMVQRLDEIDKDLADEAFQRALRFLLRCGFEPELMHSLIGLVVLYGKGSQTPDLAAMQRHADRLQDLAPLVEGTASFYRALAQRLQEEGRAAEAAQRERQAQAALPFLLLGVSSPATVQAGYWLTLFSVIPLALLLCAGVMVLRSARLHFEPPAPWYLRWNPLCRVSRLELLGLLLLVPLAAWSARRLAEGVAIIGAAAGAPTGALGGNLGHPAALAYWARPELGGAPAVELVRGLALQQAGRTQEAASAYERSGLPAAQVNLGVLRHQAGQKDAARALWQGNALPEAAHNLGRPGAGSPRVARWQRLGPGGPLLALPSAAEWGEAWRAQGRLRPENPAPLGVLSAVADLASNLGESRGPDLLFPTLGLGAVVLALLALLIPRRERRLVAKPWLPIGDWLTLLVPGTAPVYRLAGPVLLAAFLALGSTYLQLERSGGQAANVLEGIATPSYAGYFGLAAPVLPPLGEWARHWALPLALGLAAGNLLAASASLWTRRRRAA